MIFKGTFKPPAVTASNPLKIAGPGRCNVSVQGLEVTGFRAHSSTKLEAALVVLVVLVIALALGVAADKLLTAVPPIVIQLAGGAIGGLLYFFVVAGREKHVAEEPVALLIPWPQVGIAAKDMRQPGGIIIKVADGGAIRTLHFHPAGGTDDFLAVLRGAATSQDRS
jgi:hypothetical protein